MLLFRGPDKKIVGLPGDPQQKPIATNHGRPSSLADTLGDFH